LTEYLRAENRYEFFKGLDNNDAYLFGLTKSILDDLITLIGKDLALELSDTRDRLNAVRAHVFDEVKRNQEVQVGQGPLKSDGGVK
jgi:hypothetical protein